MIRVIAYIPVSFLPVSGEHSVTDVPYLGIFSHDNAGENFLLTKLSIIIVSCALDLLSSQLG